MHVALITDSIPNLEATGDHQTPLLIIKYLLDNGHKVTTCVLLDSIDPWQPERTEQRLRELEELGTQVIRINNYSRAQLRTRNVFMRLLDTINPALKTRFPEVQLAPELNQILSQLKPDAVFAWHWGPVAATFGLQAAPRVAALGALPHILQNAWWQHEPKRLSIRYLKRALFRHIDMFWLKRMALQLLDGCQVVGSFGLDQVEELRRMGLESCRFWQNPAHDFGGADWKSRRESYDGRAKFKVLIIGQVTGTFSRFGLDLFAEEVLPVLEERLGEDKIEVHIVGSFTMPEDLAKKLDSPLVKIRGWVESAEPEFLSADVLLVPNPVSLGHRSRVTSGFSCGCCVVAHEANLTAAPELVPGENILAASDGKGLADMVLSALADASLRERIGANARQTYERIYSPQVTGPAIMAELEQLAASRS